MELSNVNWCFYYVSWNVKGNCIKVFLEFSFFEGFVYLFHQPSFLAWNDLLIDNLQAEFLLIFLFIVLTQVLLHNILCFISFLRMFWQGF